MNDYSASNTSSPLTMTANTGCTENFFEIELIEGDLCQDDTVQGTNHSEQRCQSKKTQLKKKLRVYIYYTLGLVFLSTVAISYLKRGDWKLFENTLLKIANETANVIDEILASNFSNTKQNNFRPI